MNALRSAETSFIVSVQRRGWARGAVPAATMLSLVGEYAVGWVLLGLLGALVAALTALGGSALQSASGAAVAGAAAAPWLWSVLAVVVAHGLSVGAKHVIRRERPSAADGVIVYATDPSRLGFPSSHASSTMAAALVYTAVLPALWPLAVLVVIAMGASRVLLGLHFPTDVLAGYALGLVVALPASLLLQ